LGLITEIKAFEHKLGFKKTENFKTYSEEKESYIYWFFTSKTTLPYSLDDPLLQYTTGKPGEVPVDLEKYDTLYYSIESIAQVKTPVTKSLLKAPLSRFIHIIFHEDWHEQMNSTSGIEEPCAEVVSYVAAMLFTEEKFGRDSEVYQTLEAEFNNKLKESELYHRKYDELKSLYSRFHSGEITESATLSRKAELLEAVTNELTDMWGIKPLQMNNAFIAFQMTYLRHFPLMCQVHSAMNHDPRKTMAIFRSVPYQGTRFNNVEELKNIESEVTSYLSRYLQPLAETD